ncbi:MAG: hypothetical protein AAGK37_05695 [Pseudomonadota bacterium]
MALTLTACVQQELEPPASAEPQYRGSAVTFLTDDLAQVAVEMNAGSTTEALKSYADCALAEAMTLNDAEFARHVRTLTSEESGIARADAVYTLSTVRPDGDFVLDGTETRTACADQGIPGV